MKSVLKVLTITSIILAAGSSAFAQNKSKTEPYSYGGSGERAGAAGAAMADLLAKNKNQPAQPAPTNLKVTIVGTPDANGNSYTFSANVTFTSGKENKICKLVDAQMDFGDSKRLCTQGDYYIVISIGGTTKATNLIATLYHDENVIFSDPSIASNSVKIGDGFVGGSASSSKEHVKTPAELKAESL